MKARIILRKERVNKDGTSPLALKVNIPNQKAVVIGLGGLRARPGEFTARGQIKGSSDQARDQNLVLQQALGKANDILVRARLNGTTLTPSGFKAEWEAGGGSTDFIGWASKELDRMARVESLGKPTVRLYRSVIRKLRRFAPEGLPFASITKEWLEEFDAWHLRQAQRSSRAKDGFSVRVKALSTIRRFMKSAIRQGAYVGRSPFGDFKVPLPRKSIVWLTKEELQQVRRIYDGGHWPAELRGFLFSCYTGLRFSDVVALEPAHVRDGRIRMTAHKNRVKCPTELDIPLTSMAAQLLKPGFPVLALTDQHVNRVLKQVAAMAGIQKKLTFHVARHTFATLFLESGGAVEVLRELLGHSSLSITMIYVHVAGERKSSQMSLMERLLSGDQG